MEFVFRLLYIFFPVLHCVTDMTVWGFKTGPVIAQCFQNAIQASTWVFSLAPMSLSIVSSWPAFLAFHNGSERHLGCAVLLRFKCNIIHLWSTTLSSTLNSLGFPAETYYTPHHLLFEIGVHWTDSDITLSSNLELMWSTRKLKGRWRRCFLVVLSSWSGTSSVFIIPCSNSN